MRNLYTITWLIIICALMGVVPSNAQNISVSAPSRVAVGENFRISYTINTQDVQDFRSGIHSFDGLEVIAGPYTSSQSSYQMVNGHTSSHSSITYTYTLYAEKNGTYTIPSAHAKVAGKDISSQSVKITVSGSASNNQNNAPKMHEDRDEGGQVRAAGSVDARTSLATGLFGLSVEYQTA